MIYHGTPFKGAGKTFALKEPSESGPYAGRALIHVEDFYDRVMEGEFWDTPMRTFVAMNYAVHSAERGLPMDEEIVYGKDQNGFAYAVHVTELGEEIR